MTAEEIYLKLKDELTAENESSSSPERIFIKTEGQTICTIGMNRSHEIIFVEFKPNPKDLPNVEREGFVHPHPVEMLHDAGWRQAQLTQWEEAEKLLEIIDRSYKKKKPRPEESTQRQMRGKARGAARTALRPPAGTRPVVPRAGKPQRPSAPARRAETSLTKPAPSKVAKPARGPAAAPKKKVPAKAAPKPAVKVRPQPKSKTKTKTTAAAKPKKKIKKTAKKKK